ncbi:hypothetical protein GCM10011375_41000 [Hymenobacter qilianensis]|uniref:Uncharacterized protein n=2 Tax=Hymenobacter qilianensis TaxID=1385715 RepID=A0ACB5PXK0_9BACT|nr:hypothetical protein [Hymenobacter qilianensis]QNP54546.1 hypothetical protein H9L05_22625 [Hymenobacter qilianensis]GGF81858.1 hypothetical protein GCM10011375_41000 [Hymenobacter qilianensis]
MWFPLLLILTFFCSPLPDSLPQARVPQAPFTETTNNAFLSGLTERLSYTRLVGAHYVRAKRAPKLGDGRLVSFSNGANQFTCFTSADNTFTAAFTITRSEPLLAPLLVLGTEKRTVLHQLGLPRSQDCLQVINVEGDVLATLVFQEEKLAKITFLVDIDG